MPNRNARVICEECGADIRSDKLAQHKRGHARKVHIAEVKETKAERAKTLKAQLKAVIGKGTLEKLLHVFYKTDCYAPGKTAEDVEQYFEIEHDLACSCGIAKDCARTHTHLLGYWKGPDEGHKYRKLAPCFTEEKAYKAYRLGKGDSDTLKKKIVLIKHFIHAACYIQTARGWHKKTDQRNPETFATMEDKNRFLAELYGDWMWAQVSYMRYLDKKMNAIHHQLEHIEDEDRIERLNQKLIELDERQQELEKRWGEEHHYKDEEIEKDLNDFITECKEIGASLTA